MTSPGRTTWRFLSIERSMPFVLQPAGDGCANAGLAPANPPAPTSAVITSVRTFITPPPVFLCDRQAIRARGGAYLTVSERGHAGKRCKAVQRDAPDRS